MPLRYPSFYFFALVIVTSTLLSCGSYQESHLLSSDISSVRSSVVDFAQQQVGKKYRNAGKGPKSFDCSGLVAYVYGHHDIVVSGSASSILKQGKEVSMRDAQAGDLVFYKRKGRVFHVSIITRSSKDLLSVVHSTTSRGVMEENVLTSNYWKPMIHKIISLETIKK